MKYIKKFENHDSYELFITSGDYPKPNVSYCVQENEVHYNPILPMNVITYQATEKLIEITTFSPFPTSGLHTNAFKDTNGQQLTMTSHTFENGVGTIEFDGDIATIGDNAFYDCSGLTSIDIPSSVTSIGSDAFYNTPWWNTYSADTSNHYGNIIYINDVAYKAVSTAITSCEFKNGTVSISDWAFSGCHSLTSVNIPNNVTSIGNGAFASCSGLTSVTIPNSVTSIGYKAFNSCTSLTSVKIGNSVTSIGNLAFQGCTSLTSIISLAATAPKIQNNTFQSVKTNATLYVPSGSSGYDAWMDTKTYYLGFYKWVKK